MVAPLKVEFHFDFGSPNAYLAELVLPEIERRTGVKFDYVPVLLGGVYKATGNMSPFDSLRGIKNKPEYNALETQRFLRRHNITKFKPNLFFPVNTLILMRGAVAAQFEGMFEGYFRAAYHHMWVEPKKMDDPQVFRDAFLSSGIDIDRLFLLAGGEVRRQRSPITPGCDPVDVGRRDREPERLQQDSGIARCRQRRIEAADHRLERVHGPAHPPQMPDEGSGDVGLADVRSGSGDENRGHASMPYHALPYNFGKPFDLGFGVLRSEGKAQPRGAGRNRRRPDRHDQEAFVA